MPTREQVIAKIQKLLRLAESDNVNEAALAAAHAQRLMDEHRIEQAALENEVDREDDEEVEDFADKGAHLDEADHSVSAWRGWLAMAVSASQQCIIYKQIVNGRTRFQIIGRPSDVDATRYMYGYLKREIERLCQRDGKGCGMVWRNQYRAGAVDTLRERLKEQSEATVVQVKEQFGDRALVVLDRVAARMQAVEVVARRRGLRRGKGSSIRPNHGARERGAEAAKSIVIGGAKAAIGSGQKRIR